MIYKKKKKNLDFNHNHAGTSAFIQSSLIKQNLRISVFFIGLFVYQLSSTKSMASLRQGSDSHSTTQKPRHYYGPDICTQYITITTPSTTLTVIDQYLQQKFFEELTRNSL